MKPFCGFLFLLVNVLASSTGQSNLIIAVILLCICISFIYFSKKNGDSFLISLIGLLCYTWSSSWRNIFGGSFAEIPIPWFYVIGLVIVIYILVFKKLSIQRGMFFLLSALITLGFISLIISNDFSEAITDYITLLFLYTVIGTVQFAKICIKESGYFSVLKSLVYANFITCIAIIIQFIIQYFLGYNFINGSQTVLLGNVRIVSSLMFGDISSATICLGIGILIVVLDFKRFKHPYLISSVIVGGIALSSARTGFITLIITCIIYIVFSKDSFNKIKVILISILAGFIGMISYFSVRGISTIDTLLDDNGRFIGYISSFNIWSEHPVFGIGFGDKYLSFLMNMPVPHFSLLKILTQTGIIYFICLILLLIKFYRLSISSQFSYGKYMFIHSMIGALFIPGIFSARFLTIVLIVIILQRKIKIKQTFNIKK